MKELQVISYEEKIMHLLTKIFNRASVEQKISVEYLDDEIFDLVERIQQIYKEHVVNNDFSIDSLIDCLQTKDEEVLLEIAEILANRDGMRADCYTKTTYEDMLDDIVNDLIIDHEIEIFSAYPAFSKENIPSIITWALDSAKDSYYILDPPPGSFRAYCNELVAEMYYNDAQNILIEECGLKSSYDDSNILLVRKLREKVVELEGE